MRFPMLHRLAALLLLLIPLAAGPAAADTSQPRHTVETLDQTLLDVMKNAESLKFAGRYKKLEPVLDQVFDLGLMARIAVGPDWSTLSPELQRRVAAAFRNFSITTYAARFDGYSGETFEIEAVAPAGNDQIVNTKLVRTKDTPVQLNYRLRNSGQAWRIIDVYLNGTISQLANYRSEFAATLRSGGGDALVQLLERKTADLTPQG